MKYRVVKRIERKGYPASSKNYSEAHAEADNYEKRKDPKGYEKMKKVDKKLSKNELAGTHTRSGKVTVSKKVPKSLRNEVAKNHEIPELKAERRLSGKKK